MLEVHLRMRKYLCGHCQFEGDVVQEMRSHCISRHNGEVKIIKNIERFSNEVFGKIKIRKGVL